MSAKHTPGRWRVQHNRAYTRIAAGNTEIVSWRSIRPELKAARAEEDANARLMAASPDLLDAAKALIANSGHVSPFGTDASVKNVRAAGKYVAAIDALRAAISKATGDA